MGTPKPELLMHMAGGEELERLAERFAVTHAQAGLSDGAGIGGASHHGDR
jgi:hypothetical protein